MSMDCDYRHSGWCCDGGLLRPESVQEPVLGQHCPQCATHEFLQLAWQRAQRVNASCDCNTCLPRSGLGTAGFKIALDEAMRVNRKATQEWMNTLGEMV